jgi:lincosamide nucleotidyltransferase A/C/D/E
VKAEEVVELYSLLLEHGVQLWIDGGWGIDALLGRQTRPHKDLDAIAAFDDLPAMTAVLSEGGFVLKEIWGESRPVRHEGRVLLVGTGEPGGDVATAFVLKDARGRELDVHVMRLDELGHGIPVWDSIWSFPPDALEGHGVIAGSPVRCLSAATHMRTHTGYELQDKDRQDLRFLHERFGIDYPEVLAHLRGTPPHE